MNPEIVEGFLFLALASEVWESMCEIYGGNKNLARVYQLQQNINRTIMGDRPFHLYFSNLKSMWDEVHQLRPTTVNLETIKKREDKIFKLLIGLSNDYESIQSSILMKEPLPTLNNTCAMIQW